MKLFYAYLLIIFTSLSSIPVYAQSFIPTVYSVDGVQNNSSTRSYKMRMSTTRSIPFIIKDSKLDSISVNEWNRRLKFIHWNAANNGRKPGFLSYATGATRSEMGRMNYIEAEANGNFVILVAYDIDKRGISSIELPKEAPSVEIMIDNSNEENQFCYNSGNTSPLNYSRLIEYLKTHSSPCPLVSRGRWAKDQFRRLGESIVDLGKVKPQQAASLMREYNELLGPYITTEAYTGFSSDSDFKKCLNFLYSVDNAISKIRRGD